MRYFCLLIFFFTSHSFSQQRFEVFTINETHSIVDLESYTKVEAPLYKHYDVAYLDIICMIGAGFLALYHKQEGFIKRFNQDRPQSVRINGKTFFYFYDEVSTYLIPAIYSEKIILPKRYIHLRKEKGFLICKKDENYDVFISSNLNEPSLEDIQATNYFFREVVDKKDNKKLSIHLFFGKEHTFIYDSQFALLQTLNSASSFSQVEQYILKDYIILEDVPKGKDEVFIQETIYNKYSQSFILEKDKIYKISTNRVFDWSYYHYDEKILLYNYERKEYYLFKVDFENMKFLIPLDLQKDLGIQFEN